MNRPLSASPRFDSNRAWLEASGAVNANRDALIALAGVFIALPAFALTVLLPQPEPQPGADMDAAMELAAVYFRENWLALVALGLLSTLGTMAMLTLFGHASRPTVGEAIRKGLAATPIAILAQMIVGFVMTGLVLAPLALFSLAGSKALAMLGLTAGLVIAAWFWTRTSLTTPIIAAETRRNPLAAVQRSFALTRGNAGRLVLFLFLLVLAFVIAGQVLQWSVTLLVQLVAGPDAGTITGALIASMVQAAMAVYLAAAMTSSYRQLDGASQPGPFG